MTRARPSCRASLLVALLLGAMVWGSVAATPVSAQTEIIDLDFSDQGEETGFLLPQDILDDVLLTAAKSGDIDAVAHVLTRGADMAARDADGWTAPMHAAFSGNVLLLKRLAMDGDFADEAALAAPGGEPDIIMAALSGAARQDARLANQLLNVVRVTAGPLFEDSYGKHRSLAASLGFSTDFVDSLPQPAPAFPAYGFPDWMPTGKAGWEGVQRVLRAEGLYDARIDGIYGENTGLGVLGYLDILAPDMMAGCRDMLKGGLAAHKAGRQIGGYVVGMNDDTGLERAKLLVVGRYTPSTGGAETDSGQDATFDLVLRGQGDFELYCRMPGKALDLHVEKEGTSPYRAALSIPLPGVREAGRFFAVTWENGEARRRYSYHETLVDFEEPLSFSIDAPRNKVDIEDLVRQFLPE